MNFEKRLDGAVSITVVLEESENKVEGSSPRLCVRALVKPFLFFYYSFAFAKMQGIFVIYTFAEKACFGVLCTCKAMSLNLVWRYGNDAGAVIENVYTFCMEEKKSGMNHVWDRTAALVDVSRTTAQKIVEEKKKAQDEQQQPKQPPSSTSKVSLGDQGVVRRTIVSMYILKKVLPTLDNIRTELKQSIGYTRIKGRLRKDLLHTKFAYTRCG